jgi:hypothetical protein
VILAFLLLFVNYADFYVNIIMLTIATDAALLRYVFIQIAIFSVRDQ